MSAGKGLLGSMRYPRCLPSSSFFQSNLNPMSYWDLYWAKRLAWTREISSTCLVFEPGQMPGIKNAEAWLEFKYRFTVEAWIYFLGDPWGLGLSLKQTLNHPKNYLKKILINYGTSESLSLNLWLFLNK